jgi:UDP-2,4-diacetamido-2,4,6-trideoxy-beta-L-altropyranose hydrolase
MRVAFRADAATIMGTGHVVRCLTLADELRAKGSSARFVTRLHTGHVADLIRDRGFEVLALPERAAPRRDPASWLGTTPEADAAETEEALAPSGPIDWLVVDHYALDASWHARLRGVARRLLVIDDLADRELDADLVLDQNVGAEERPYDAVLRRPATTLLGPRFALLAPAFGQARARKTLATASEVSDLTVLVSLGGTDPEDATSAVLARLAPELGRVRRVDVVIGRAHPDPERVQAACGRIEGASVHVQTARMPELLEGADVAIGAAGSSTWERLCVGVPTLTLPLADNQRPTLDALERDGLVVTPRSDWRRGEALLDAFRGLLEDTRARAELARRGRALVDGAGAARVARAMLAAPVTLPAAPRRA